MAVVTLADAATGKQDTIEKGVVRTLIEETPIARVMQWKEIASDTYTWFIENVLPTIGTRSVGGSYVPSKGSHISHSRQLKIFGGEVSVDRYIIKTAGANLAEEEKVKQFRLWAVAQARYLDQMFFEGDDVVDPTQPRGLRKIVDAELASTQKILCAAGGGQLTLDKFHALRDAVAGPPGTLHAFMNRKVWRKLDGLLTSQTGSQRIEVEKSQFNMPTYRYQDLQLHIMEHQEDATSVLGFDEDPGDAVSDTASIYAMSINKDNGVHGIVSTGGIAPEMQDYGEVIPPNHIGFGEWYLNFVCKQPRALARLYGILTP
jgi:hypothetical protein